MSIKPWHLEWNTPGSPETERRDLAASYRDIIDTKPLRFLKPNPELSWKSNRKPEKAEWTEPIEKPKRRKQRNPHTFPTLKYLNLGRLMRCNVCEKYEPFCKKKNDRRNSICFIRYFRPNTSAFETQTLYQHQSALPYMGCCTLPCSLTKRTNDTGSHATITVKKNVDVLSILMTCNGRYSEDEVRPANYIKFN